MKEVYENIRTRRSVKQYDPDRMPPKEAIDRVIEAGLCAASGRNQQASVVVAVTNRALRDELSAMNARVMGAEGVDPFYGAPVVLIVLADKNCPTHVYDGSLTLGNMLLAAHAEGLGACWIHRAKEEFESKAGKAFLEKLGVPGDLEGIGHCVLGYPAGEMRPTPGRRGGRVYYAE